MSAANITKLNQAESIPRRYEVEATLGNGRKVKGTARNLGWGEILASYDTHFVFAFGSFHSMAPMPRHEQYVCPDPTLRLSIDREAVECYLSAMCGSPCIELEFRESVQLDEDLVDAFVQILNSPCDFDDRPRVMERMREHPREAEVALTRIERTIQVLRQQIRAGL